MRSSPPVLPAAVRAAAEAAVAATPVKEEFAWMSWAGTVWRVSGANGALFVKHAADLAGERDRLAWLAGRWPVPEVIGFFREAGDEWLLTREIRGVPMSHPALGWPPSRVAATLGRVLRALHATEASECPFGTRKRGHVLIHGDYCLPNLLVSDDELSGLVDVGGTGLGNPEADLAAGIWTLQYNFGGGLARAFLDAYGWPPMSDEAIERLRRKYGR